MKKSVIFARAPSRIDFAGGTLDLPYFAEKEKGATLNCAVKKYGYASIIENGKNLVIDSINYNQKVVVKWPVKYDDRLDLIKAAIKRKHFRDKVTLTAYHEVAPHSHLGTSSSISVAILGAISRYLNEKINKVDIAKLATVLEIEELGLANGPQDEYAAAVGGINMLRFNGKSVGLEQLKLKNDTIYELEKNFLLCYIGSNKVSGDLNGHVVKKYESGDDKVVNAIRNIKRITFEMYKALINHKLSDFPHLMNEERVNRDHLGKGIVDHIDKEFLEIGFRSGAIGAKVLGSGGGGTILFYLKDNCKEKFKHAMARTKAEVYDFRFDFEGLQTWERKA